MMASLPPPNFQFRPSLQSLSIKLQIISVPDTHGIPRQHPANDYQVRAARSILTGEPMTVPPQPLQGSQQASLASFPSASSIQSTGSVSSQVQQQQGIQQVVQRYL